MIEKITAILFPPANKPTPLPFISDEHMDNKSLLLVGYIAGQTDISKSIHPSSEIIKNSQMEATPCEKI